MNNRGARKGKIVELSRDINKLKNSIKAHPDSGENCWRKKRIEDIRKQIRGLQK